MSGIIAGHFPHLPPTPGSAGAGAKVPPRGEEVHEREAPRAIIPYVERSLLEEPRLMGLRAQIMEYIRRITIATGQGPTLVEIEVHLGREGFLAQGHVYWLEGSGFLRAERTEGGRRHLRPTHKEYRT